MLYAAAFGSANKDFGAPNTIDTKFNLGSMNKLFTAVIIAQLVEQGKLSYDDPLSKFLPDYPSVAAAGQVKIMHLLTHTSVLGSYFNDQFFNASRERFRSVDDMMQLAKGDSLAFAPGTRWSYSNTGMLVLGKVIEVVTKQDYVDYVREHLTKPAGMASTDAYELDGVNTNLAVGYETEYAEDGTKRYRNAGKLVTPATFELMTTPKPEVSSPRYGFGFQLDAQGGHRGAQRGLPRHQLQPGHLQGDRLRRRGDGELW